MIQANELRLGNWVSNGERYYPVDINVLYDIATLEYFPIEPIPLTPEVLEKCGFRKMGNDYAIKSLILHSRKRGFVINNKIPVISSLHQLQNLYYCLTGKELGINA